MPVDPSENGAKGFGNRRLEQNEFEFRPMQSAQGPDMGLARFEVNQVVSQNQGFGKSDSIDG